MAVRAVIFELSGALIDDVAFHREAWAATAAKIGALLPESAFQTINGLRNEDVFPRLLGRDLGPSLLAALGRDREEHYRSLCVSSRIRVVAGAPELLARARGAGIKLGLASSAPEETRAMLLAELGWSDHFDAVAVPEAHEGKPEADIFVATARSLGVPPAECLVFEGTWNGVKAAACAAMPVVGVTTNAEPEVLLRAGALRTIPDYTRLPVDLESLMSGSSDPSA